MNEKIKLRQRARESLITFSVTIFSVFLAYVTVASHWSPLIIPVIAIEIACAWWGYLRDFKTFTFRAIILTLFCCVNIFFYGVHAIDFQVLIPTLSCFLVLITLCQVQPALDIVIICNALLFVYHVFFRGVFIRESDPLAVNRTILQLLSLIVLTFLCVYSIHRRMAEERDLIDMEHLIKRTQKIKDDFVVNTSHELRTPIHTISGMSEILLQENLPEEVHREVLDIQMTGIELQTIVSDIMDFAALESGTLELHPRAYNITSTLNDIMNMTVFQNREKKLELIFDCDPGIPCSLYGDEQQLRRVINNLIGNAVKFTAEGGVRVSVTYRKEAYGINLIVAVKDTGIGLSAEEQEHIFQGFYQADADRNRRVEGMGLGLTISSAIVKKMGGFMTVRSVPGKGSEFAFSIPQAVYDDRPCIALTHPNLVQAVWYFDEQKSNSAIRDDYIEHINHTAEYLGIALLRSSSLTELKRRMRSGQFTHLLIGMEEYREDPIYFDETALQLPVILLADREQTMPKQSRIHILYKPYNALTLAEMFNGGDMFHKPKRRSADKHFVAPDAKILVVDDNLMNLKVVEGLLRKYRIKITAASSGEEALSLIDSRDYEFVFMDHMMPGMDGIECFHRIRAKQGSPYYQNVPVIALTANAIAGSREMFLEEGFTDFVAKPIDNALLDHVLRKYIAEDKQLEEDDIPEEMPIAGVTEKKDPFRSMEGIDMDLALTYCGGALSDYIDLANVYLGTGEKYRTQLSAYYGDKDWKNYAVVAHAIKSTSKTIGATKLSEIAYKEEMAAKASDESVINQYHQAMLGEYERVLNVLAANPEIKKTVVEADPSSLVPIEESEWKRIKADLQKSLETFEAGAFEETVDRYRAYLLEGVPFAERLKEVREKVDEFEFDEAARILDRIGGTHS